MGAKGTEARCDGTQRGRHPATAVLVVLVVVSAAIFGAGCAPVTRSVQAAPAAPAKASADSSAASVWEGQAKSLARAMQDLEGQLESKPEPAPGTQPNGVFTASVLDADTSGTVLYVDRYQLLRGSAAQSAAKKAGVTLVDDVYGVDTSHERLPLTVAKDAVFIVWQPPEGFPNVSSSGRASMTAMSFGQFEHSLKTDPVLRENMRNLGGWLSVQDGVLTSFVAIYGP